MAILSSFYAIYHGPKGLTKIAKKIVFLRSFLERSLRKLGFQINQGIRFDSFDVYSEKSVDILQHAEQKGFNFRILPLGSDIKDAKGFGISIDELSDMDEIHQILKLIANAINTKIEFSQIPIDNQIELAGIPLREEKFMQQNIFNSYQSETDLMRYILCQPIGIRQ